MQLQALVAIGASALVACQRGGPATGTPAAQASPSRAAVAPCAFVADDENDCAVDRDVAERGRAAVKAVLTAFDPSTLQLFGTVVATGAPYTARFTRATAFRPAPLDLYDDADPCRAWAATYNAALAAWTSITNASGEFDTAANPLANVVDLVNSSAATIGARRCRARVHAVTPTLEVRAFLPVP